MEILQFIIILVGGIISFFLADFLITKINMFFLKRRNAKREAKREEKENE